MAKKYLGQNFLKNKKILREIAEVAELSKNDTVLEIGPGHGELTELLAEKAKRVIAVEKDRELIPWLREKFKLNKNVEIKEGDILKSKILNLKSGYKIVANIPYYITSRFLRTYLSDTECRPKLIECRPKLMVIMVQYEVAKRIAAKPPEMSLLALSVQAYAKPKFIRKVSRRYFRPEPKVDSAIIKISDISDKFFKKNKISERKFFELLRAAFSQRRKMLRRSLKNYSLPKKFQPKRPQELSLEEWLEVYKTIS